MQAKNKKEWIEVIYERDKNICKKCGGYVEGQIPHHVKPKGRYPELALETDNGILLHMKCHRWVHDNPKEAHKLGLFYVGKYE